MPVPAPPLNQPAAANWEKGYQGGGTLLTPISPTLRPVISGSPEGVYYAGPGVTVVTTTGRIFSKSTAGDVNTGWVEAT